MRRIITAAGAACLVNAALSFYLTGIPLFDILGYDYSLVFSLAVYLSSGILVIVLRPLPQNMQRFDNPLFFAVLCLGVALVPFLFMTLRGIFSTNCNYLYGAAFYAVLPLVSSMFGAAMGCFISSLSKKAFWRTVLFICVSAVFLAKAPFDLLYTPSVDLYNHIFGYFAGPIYDETVEINKPLIFYRAYTLLLSLLLFVCAKAVSDYYAGRPKLMLIKQAFLAALLATGVVLVNLNSQHLGFKKNERTIRKELSRAKTSEHFKFNYHAKNERDIDNLLLEFEFRHHQNSKFLNVLTDHPISVFIYPDSKTQKKLMGSRGTFIAKPSNRQIHMTAADAYDLPIKHELVHIMAGDFGPPVLKAPVKIGLLEGLAVAAEGYRGPLTFDEYSRALEELGMLPQIRSIIGLGFWSKQSARAYFTAGSFCGYLIDRYGIETFKKIYSGASFKKAYSKSLDELAIEWKSKIQSENIGAEQKKLAESIFKPKGIFSKLCARETARLVDRAMSLRDREDKRDQTLDILGRALLLSGNSPEIANRIIQKLYAYGRYEEALAKAHDLAGDENAAPFLTAEALRISGNCRILEGKRKEALADFQRIESLIYNDSFDSHILINEAKIRLLKNKIHLSLVRQYLAETDEEKRLDILGDFATNINKNEAFNLLTAKIHHNGGRFEKSLDYLKRVREHPNVYTGRYHRKLEIMNYFALGNYDEASKILRSDLKGKISKARRMYLNDWLERIEFFKRKRAQTFGGALEKRSNKPDTAIR